MNRQRYDDYYLVNDEDMANGDDSIEFLPKKTYNFRKVIIILSIIIFALAVISFILIFVVFPFIFRESITLQQDLVFTRWNLETHKIFFSQYRFPGYKNHYVTVKDLDNTTTLQLGLWHILPTELMDNTMNNDSYNYDDALRNSNHTVLLYFHGTGEDRSQNSRKYQMLRYFFHVIAFDYRSYGDSDKGKMFEKNVVNDCIQIYKWLRRRTDAKIIVWGHSLGASLAASMLAHLGEHANVTGLILEAAFTNLKEELYYHPNVKYFRWLPWFEFTVVTPLEDHGFIFNNSQSILKIPFPIMFLHAEDDQIVPYFMSKELYNISNKRNIDAQIKNETLLVLFDEKLRLNHYFIYQDSYVVFYIYEFLQISSKNLESQDFEGSHQS